MWEKGRQVGGYLKRKLFCCMSKKLSVDCYLIKYPTNSFIPEHVDPVDGHRHYRFNMVIQKAYSGGFFVKNGKRQDGNFHFFRPDVDRHAVTKITTGERMVLSFGLAIRRST